MNLRSIAPIGLGVAVSLATAATAGAQVSTYYTTAGDQSTNWATQGGAVQFSFPQIGDEYAIAVLNTIRTQGNGNPGLHGLGAEYTLAGVFTGNTYPYALPATSCVYDGTTDGKYNYLADYCRGGVWRTGLDWTNPEFLFSTATGTLGITFDPFRNELWTSVFGSGHVDEYSMAGVLLGGFNTVASEDAALAMDYADGSLWMNDSQGSFGDFSQYDVNGNLLQQVHYAGMEGANTLGGEFRFTGATATPEPATIALSATGLLALAGYARRRRSTR